MEDNIVRNIINIMKDYDVPGSCIELEITENAIMDDMDSIIRKLQKLSSHDITIAIDDFGTGYSSLADLRQTLALNPRHFGAMRGLAVVLDELGERLEALEVLRRVAELYPADAQAEAMRERLERELDGRTL